MAAAHEGLAGAVPEAELDAGFALLSGGVAALPDSALDAPSRLEGWTRRHLLAHLASNAEALTRLCSWAATGVESRMYSSPEQRVTEIEAGAGAAAEVLRSRLRSTGETLSGALAAVPSERWSAEVVTAQGRTVPATEVPWMRAREVWLHAVDLEVGVEIEALPADFCRRLVGEVAHWRGARPGGPALQIRAVGEVGGWEVAGDGDPTLVEGSLPELAGWLTGRVAIAGAPVLSAWI